MAAIEATRREDEGFLLRLELLIAALLLALGGGTAYALSRHRRALERLAHQHAGILGSVGEGIITIDRDGRIVYTNAAAKRDQPRRRARDDDRAHPGSPAAATLQDGRTRAVARAAVHAPGRHARRWSTTP